MDDKTIISGVKTEYNWIKAHERIIALFLVLIVGCFLGNKWLNYDAAKKDAQYAALAQKLDEREKQDDANAKVTAAVTAQYQAMVETLSRQNAALAGAIASRDVALKQKQEQIASMTLPQVAQEWEKTLNLPSGALPVQGAAVVVTEPIARSTVSQLTKTATLEQDLNDAIQLGGNYKTELEGANKVISTQETEIKGLEATNVLQDQTCKAEIVKVKADARKSKRNWFGAGFVAGIATRILVKF